MDSTAQTNFRRFDLIQRVPLAVCTGLWYFMVRQEAKAYCLQRRQTGFWQQWSSQVTRFLARAVCGCGIIDPLWELSPALHLILCCSLPHLLTSLFRCYLPDYCHWSAPMHGSSPEVPNIMKLNNLSIHFHWNSWWSCCGRHGGRRIVALGELVWAAQCTRLRQTCHKSHRYSHRFLQKTIWQSMAGYWVLPSHCRAWSIHIICIPGEFLRMLILKQRDLTGWS